MSAGAGPGRALAPGAGLRRLFPLLRACDEGGGRLAYLDNAATTHKPSCVLEAENKFYLTANANPHRSLHRLAQAATQALELARSEVAGFFGADADEIVFTGGATQALNMLAYPLCAARLKPGDEVVLSLLEHHSNLVPWQAAARCAGASVAYLVPDGQGAIGEEEIERAIGPRTRIVALTHASNVLGCMPPLQRVVQAARSQGALVVLDCAQSAAHVPISLHELEVDFAAFAAHKMYGPMGVGALYGRREQLAQLDPLLKGGGMVERVFEQSSTFAAAPYGLEAGTQNVAGAVGFAQACRFLSSIDASARMRSENALLRRMLRGLESIPSVKLYGAASDSGQPRCGIAAFNVRGVEAGLTARALDRRDVAVRAGTHCAQPLLRHLGLSAACRASLAVYNTEEEVDRFLEAVEAAQREAVALETARLF